MLIIIIDHKSLLLLLCSTHSSLSTTQLEKINAEEKLARLNPKERKKQQEIEEKNRRHEEERVNKLSKLGSVFARGPGARPLPPPPGGNTNNTNNTNNRSILTKTPRPESSKVSSSSNGRPESRSLSPTLHYTNAHVSRPESRSLNTISPTKRLHQNNNIDDNNEQLVDFNGNPITILSPRSVSLGSRIFSFFSSSPKPSPRY